MNPRECDSCEDARIDGEKIKTKKNQTWTASHLSYAEAAALMRAAGYLQAADEADAAEELWFDESFAETDRCLRAEKMFRAAIARAKRKDQ